MNDVELQPTTGDVLELILDDHRRFEELQVLLDETRDGDGFVFYDELSEDQVKQLSDAVNALGERNRVGTRYWPGLL